MLFGEKMKKDRRPNQMSLAKYRSVTISMGLSFGISGYDFLSIINSREKFESNLFEVSVLGKKTHE